MCVLRGERQNSTNVSKVVGKKIGCACVRVCYDENDRTARTFERWWEEDRGAHVCVCVTRRPINGTNAGAETGRNETPKEMTQKKRHRTWEIT